MRISAKTEYGLRAMLALALYYGRGTVQIRDIAEAEGIPTRYLEQLLLILRKNGLVNSLRGAAGGYILTNSPNRVKIKQIVEALEGPIDLRPALPGRKRRNSVTEEVWSAVQRELIAVLSSITLDELAAKKQARDKTVMFHI